MISQKAFITIKDYEDIKKLVSVYDSTLLLQKNLRSRCTDLKKKSYDVQIAEIQKLQEIALQKKTSLERKLQSLVNVEDTQFRVYYLHYVKNKSLTTTARRCYYTRRGVCKILKEIMDKVR